MSVYLLYYKDIQKAFCYCIVCVFYWNENI